MTGKIRVELQKLYSSLLQKRERVITTHEGGQFVRRSFEKLAKDTASAIEKLKEAGLRAGMRVGVISENSYWWLVYDLALIELRAIGVPMPETDVSSSDASLFETNELNLLLVSSRFKPADFDCRPDVMLIDTENPRGRRVRPSMPVRYPARDGDHAYAVGSGTTGGRKGMVVWRRGVEAIIEEFGEAFGSQDGDSILIFMPLWAHQQRLFFYGAIAFNMDLHVVDAAMVFHAVRDLQPTIIIGPPVFYETFQRQNLCRWFGPKTRVLVTGMAKSRRSTLEYYCELGLPLYEVYAMTETGIVAANTPECQRLGSTGKPPPGTEVRIAEDGEILVKKPHFQTRGYFRGGPQGVPHEWADGEWFYTGDVGHFDDDGFLYVDGRKDDTIINAQGQKLQPAVIEADLENASFVRKAVVLQDADHPYLLAVIDSDQRGEPDLEPKLQALIDAVNEKLPSWFRIERFAVSPESFTPQNGFLTPNLKVARPKIAKAFAKAQARET
jgi:long-subunit acyl-CoA synthetase (AMP-forming)